MGGPGSGKAKQVRTIVIDPSPYPCCEDGVCPQHEEQGKSDIEQREWNRMPKAMGKTYSGPFLDRFEA